MSDFRSILSEVPHGEADGAHPAGGRPRHRDGETPAPEVLRLALRLKSGAVTLPQLHWTNAARGLSAEQRAAVINRMLDEDEAARSQTSAVRTEPIQGPAATGQPEVVTIQQDDLVAAYQALREIAALGQPDPREWRAITQLRLRIKALAEEPARRVAQALPAAARERADRDAAARTKPEPTPHRGITDTASDGDERWTGKAYALQEGRTPANPTGPSTSVSSPQVGRRPPSRFVAAGESWIEAAETAAANILAALGD